MNRRHLVAAGLLALLPGSAAAESRPLLLCNIAWPFEVPVGSTRVTFTAHFYVDGSTAPVNGPAVIKWQGRTISAPIVNSLLTVTVPGQPVTKGIHYYHIGVRGTSQHQAGQFPAELFGV